jgi:hypothetical protein
VAEARLAEAQQLIQAIQQADGPLRSPGSFAGSVLTPADIIERERVGGPFVRAKNASALQQPLPEPWSMTWMCALGE